MKTCLIVDDSRIIRKVARRILEELDFEVAEAADGSEALSYCRSEMPDAILLDWVMPVMDGVTFLRQLRNETGGRSPKVIFCTAAAAAFAVPSAAQAASPCYVHLPGPNNLKWDVKTDGSLDSGLFNGGGQNFASNHGRLAVNGVTYPAIDNQCTTTATSVSYPARSVGGMTVSRLVTVTGGRLRHLDTITNNSGQFKLVDVDFAAKVTSGQLSVAAETGGFEIDRHDHWAVFKSAGSTYPALQWGTDASSAHDPDILSDNPDSPSIWRPDGPSMPSATLKYDGIQIASGQTIRVLHVSSSTASLADGKAVAKDQLTPFTGFSKATASTIVNWGDDPDGDAVSKFADACPSVKGNMANGCLADVAPPPVDPQDPGDPQNPGNPQNPGDPGF